MLGLAGALAHHRLGSCLQDVELAVDAVLAPLDVHRPAVVLFDDERVAGELGDVGIGERIAVAQLGRGLDRRHQLAARGAFLGRGERHPDQLGAQVPADDRLLAVPQRRLVNIELVGIDGALHHRLAQTVARGDEDDVGKAAFGVDREHHAGGAEVAANHPLHSGRQRDVAVGVALVDAIADGAVVVETGEDLAHLGQNVVDSRDVEVSLLLACERGLGQVFGGRRRAHREGRAGVDRRAAARTRAAPSASNAAGNGCASIQPRICGTGLGQRANVVGVERRQPLGDAPRQAALGEERAKGMRRGCEAAGNANPRLAQLADHFAEGCVLAADRLDVGHSQGVEWGDQGGRQMSG